MILKKNLLLMCHPGVTKVQCNHKTKSGRRCKLKSHMFNYGRCHIHGKDILPKENIIYLIFIYIIYLQQIINFLHFYI